jgi:hypothetical protein
VSLERSLRLFHELVTAPENVRLTMAARGIPRERVLQTFAGDERLDAVGRLDVYADMYFFRIRDVLREQFERVALDLGDAGFHDLVTDYLASCPPRSPSLRDAGDRLSGYLRGHDVAAGRPWLPDLAQLEWLRLDVFDEADAPVLGLEAVRAVPPDRFGEIPLAAVPAHRLLEASWDVSSAPAPGPATILVWRQGLEVLHRPVREPEREALALVRSGCTFADVCTLLAGHLPEDEVASAAFELLARWIGDGLLVAGGAVG